MVYFNQRAATSKTRAETDQWGQVLDFQQRFPKEGLWWPYQGKAQFEKLVRNHLTQFLRQRGAYGARRATHTAGTRHACVSTTARQRGHRHRARSSGGRGQRCGDRRACSWGCAHQYRGGP